MNICFCGSEEGYPHATDCPRPMFRGSVKDAEKWEQERRAKRATYRLHAFLAGENAVLDPEDAGPLAAAIVAQFPEIVDALEPERGKE